MYSLLTASTYNIPFDIQVRNQTGEETVDKKCYKNFKSLTTFSEAMHIYLVSCIQNTLSTKQLLK